jgi:intracellular multiplication protein IcmJ
VTFFPITLGARPSAGSEGLSLSPAQIVAQADKAKKRDDYTCRFCGFRSEKFQRIIPCADAGKGLPFATVCTFCEQAMIIERAGVMGSGVLVWLPEIQQAELNHIVRAIFVARAAKKDGQAPEIGDAASRAYDALMARRADARKRLGSDDPLMLATILHEFLNEKDEKDALGKLDGIRVMAFEKYLVRGPKGDVDQFPLMVDYWRSPQGPFAELPIDKWGKMLASVS